MEQHPTLYILMRTDMDSLNPGKAMAQAAHAANQFAAEHGSEEDATGGFLAWASQTAGSFGTTIVLDVQNEAAMQAAVLQARGEGFMADIVHDPTYPVRDGKVTHLIPLDTCAYVFTPCRVTQEIKSISEMTLHP